MFGRKKKNPSSEPIIPEPEPETEPPRVKLGDDILDTSWDAAERFDISDVDFGDIDKPRIKLRSDWKDLELYKTTIRIELTDVTFHGQWGGGLIRRDDDKWGEKLVTTTNLWAGRDKPVLTFFENDHEAIERGRSKFQFYIAQFETDVYANGAFGELDHLVREDRPLEEFYCGSPAKLFREATEADEFIESEIMAYSEHRYPPDKPIPDRKQIHCWPEVVQGGDNYRNEYHDPIGFYGSSINLPVDVFNGIRRAIADFGTRVKVELSVETELYGAEVTHYEYTDSPSSASISVLPRNVQITGKLKGVNVRWDDEKGPANNPSFWTRSKKQDLD